MKKFICLIINFHNVASPFKANGPILIRKKNVSKNVSKNEIPKMLEHRLISLRIYDKKNKYWKMKPLIIFKCTTQNQTVLIAQL